MLNIGSHLSISNGFEAVGIQALEIGANTFQFFTRNPRGGAARKIDNEDIERLKTLMKNNGFSQIVAHAPYTMNLCSANIQVREFAYNTLVDDLNRMEYLPNNFYNLHPGSHTGQGTGIGISQIADALNRAVKPNMHTIVLLETMAGKGSEIGSKFEELRAIIDLVEYKDRIGVCFDTCHVFDAGYDIVSSLDGVLSEFDSIIGIDRLCAVHLNDTMNYLGCHKDRHEKIGMGAIGIDAFERIINHKYLRDLPFILETPNEIDGYSYEIALLKQKYYE